MTAQTGEARGETGVLKSYIRLARLDHSTKHIFIVPGLVLCYLLRQSESQLSVYTIFLGFACAVFIASANYTINEWLDRDYDKFHPTKSLRASVQMALSGKLVALQWILLVMAGLVCAWLMGSVTLLVALVFALQGVVYNVPPIRLKDVTYFDVISESINNPLRLMIGWSMVDPTTCPPASIILAYWLGGGFLMAAKRYSEYRELTSAHGKDLLVRYRASFAGYSEVSLNVSCLIYAMMSAFFLAVFLLKYRVEYLLATPFLAAFFGEYLALSLRPQSSAQSPEKLYKEGRLIVLVIMVVIVSIIATFVDMPVLQSLAEQRFMSL